MATPADRLLEAREKAGFSGPTEAAAAFGWNAVTYRSHENGTRNLSRQAAARYAQQFRVTAGWLLYGEKQKATEPVAQKVRLAGHIGAGQQVIPDETFNGFTEAALAPDDCEAFEVRGSSMLPVARDGDIVFFGHPRPVPSLIGRECIVELADGRRFFKILRHGSKAGLFTLDSYNQEPIQDVRVLRAGPLLALRRR